MLVSILDTEYGHDKYTVLRVKNAQLKPVTNLEIRESGLDVVAFSSGDFAMAGAWGSSTGHRRRQRESDVEGAAHPEVVNSTSRLLCVRRGIRSVYLSSLILCRHWITVRLVHTTSLSLWASLCAHSSFAADSTEPVVGLSLIHISEPTRPY